MNDNSTDSSAHQHAVDQSPVVRIARELAPDLDVVSVAEPLPRIRQHNVVALLSSTEDARKAVLMLEGAEPTDGEDSIGLVVMAGGPVAPESPIDPEGATSGIAGRIALGAAIGAVVGAAVGLGVGALSGELSLLVAGLVSAALMAVFGGIWAVFSRFGGSDAYRQTFVEPHARDVSVVSFHTDDAQLAEDVFTRLSSDGAPVRLLDESLTHTLRRAG